MLIQDIWNVFLNHQRYKISHNEVINTSVILDILPQTLNPFRACHIFSIIFPNFWLHFVEMRPHMVTLRNFDGTIL